MLRKSLSAALFVSAAASVLPATSFAGVMPIADNATVSVSAPTTQAHWEPYRHRHHRWHMGWHYGWPRYRYGMYAGWNPANAPRVYGYAAPVATYGYSAPVATYGAGCGTYGSAYPYGTYGSAYPSCGCGTYGYGGYGGGLFGMGTGLF